MISLRLFVVLSVLLSFCAAEKPDEGVTTATEEEQNYLIPLGSLFVFFVLLPSIYLWKKEPDYMTPQEKKSKALASLSYSFWRHIGWFGPSVSIFACVVTSLILHFDNVTTTHCPGPNPLPSISAAVGNNIPERWFFRFGILIMSGQRMVDGIITYTWYKRYLPNTHWFSWLNQVAMLFHYLENFALFAIAMISSIEYYPAHEKAFMSWAFLQQARMVITMYMFKNVSAHPFAGYWELRSWRLKWIPWLINTLALVASGIVFVLHNLYCWPYLYAAYGFFEYVVVGSNIVYACSVACDWPDGLYLKIKVGKREEDTRNP
jgi:hypothetical protein